MRKILLIVFLLVTTLNNAYAENFMDLALNSWLGYSIDDVIAVWGFPTAEKNITGRTLVYWTNNQYELSGNQYYISGVETFCNKIFEIDKNKKIISWEYKGNACPSFYFTGKNLVNPKNDYWQQKKQLKKIQKEEKKKLKQKQNI